MDSHILRILGPLFCHFVHFFLPSEVRLLINLRVAIMLNDVSVCHGTSIGQLVRADLFRVLLQIFVKT